MFSQLHRQYKQREFVCFLTPDCCLRKCRTAGGRANVSVIITTNTQPDCAIIGSELFSVHFKHLLPSPSLEIWALRIELQLYSGNMFVVMVRWHWSQFWLCGLNSSNEFLLWFRKYISHIKIKTVWGIFHCSWAAPTFVSWWHHFWSFTDVVEHIYIYIHYRSKVWDHPDNFVSSMKNHTYLSNEYKI